MNVAKLFRWICMGVLSAAMSLTLISCGHSDDDDDTAPATETPATTEEGGGAGTPAATPTPSTPGGSSTPGGNPPTVTFEPDPLVAPELLWPPYGYLTEAVASQGTYLGVMFQWTAVNGASDYVLEVDGLEYPTYETSATIMYTVGYHTWTVRARSSDGTLGPPAQPFAFSVPLLWGP